MHRTTEIYYWPRSFLMRTRDFVQSKPYQRITTTLIAAPQGDLRVQTEDRGKIECAGIVLGPSARRLALELRGGAGFLIEAEPRSEEHRALMAYLQHSPSKLLDEAALARLLPVLDAHARPTLDAARARQLHRLAISAVHVPPPASAPDSRIVQVLDHLERASLDEVLLSELARQVGLSESRLRSLARKHLGCNLSQYMRWLAAWKIAMVWRPGLTLTDAAHAAGFHDLSHANHAFNEMFGMSPSRVVRSDEVSLVNCAEESSSMSV